MKFHNFRRDIEKKNVKAVKDSGDEKEEIIAPKAVRHIILIRHGQYNLAGVGDKERFLTDLGIFLDLCFTDF